MSQYTTIPTLGVSREDNKMKLVLDNIKCGGCANTISKSLTELNLVDVAVDHENNQVEFQDPKNDELVLVALNKLRKLGYPVVDSEDGLSALALKAKSFTSCAIGKMTK